MVAVICSCLHSFCSPTTVPWEDPSSWATLGLGGRNEGTAQPEELALLWETAHPSGPVTEAHPPPATLLRDAGKHGMWGPCSDPGCTYELWRSFKNKYMYLDPPLGNLNYFKKPIG